MNRRSFLALLSAAAALPKVAMAALRSKPKSPKEAVLFAASDTVLAIADEPVRAGDFLVWTSYLPSSGGQRVPVGTVRRAHGFGGPIAGVAAQSVSRGTVRVIVKGAVMVRADE